MPIVNLPESVPVEPSSVPHEKVTYTLAAELAAKLYSVPEIMERFGLNKNQFTRIITDEHFQEVYREAKSIWSGTDNIKERIRKKAGLLLEDSILPVYSIIHNKELAPAARLDGFAKLVEIADMKATPGNSAVGPAGEGFKLNITIGDTGQTVTIEGESNVEENS